MARFKSLLTSRGRYALPLLALSFLILSACGDQARPPKVEEGVLTYAALNPLSEELAESVERFNKAHSDVKIEIQDYSDENGVERLLTELSLGWVPDIMEMYRIGGRVADRIGTDVQYNFYHHQDHQADNYWMPYRQMAQKGYLEDLWPYIENDPDLGLDAVLLPPLKASEANGGLYMLFGEVAVITLMGPEYIVGDRPGWTLDELLETFSTMSPESTVLRHNTTRDEVFFRLLSAQVNQFVDWAAKETSFENEKFYELVDFLETFPDKLETNQTHSQIVAECARRMQEGEQMLEVATLAMVPDVARNDTFFRDRSTYIGYPTLDGSLGSMFTLHGEILSMSATCQNKDAAWEFMRPILTQVYSGEEMTYMHQYALIKIPINLENYHAGNEADLENPYIYTHGPAGVDYPEAFQIGPIKDPEYITRFDEVVQNTSQIYWPDDELANIVWECLGPYFAGDRTMEDTVRMLDSRVGLMISERQ